MHHENSDDNDSGRGSGSGSGNGSDDGNDSDDEMMIGGGSDDESLFRSTAFRYILVQRVFVFVSARLFIIL